MLLLTSYLLTIKKATYFHENDRVNLMSVGSAELTTQKVIRKHCDFYQLHDSLKKELQDLSVTKIPSSEKIKRRIENLFFSCSSHQETSVQQPDCAGSVTLMP
jgi:hypothetical protein